MTTIESKIRTLYDSEEIVYNFFSDFRNFDRYIPHDKVENWESSPESCSFSVKNIGKISIHIADRTPFNYIKISPSGKMPFKFNIYIQLKQIGEKNTKIKLTIKAELNQMMKMVIKKPLKKALDEVVDKLAQITFPNPE